jgi:lysine-N-methylase
MIYRVPEYYREFRCIADKCRDSCCIGWEIDVDPETAEIYESTGGDFGERLRSSISDGSFILQADDRCPFLNESGLCDIYTELGENCLCQICTDHPRYYEWFGSVKEGGIGLCCEEAARLVLSGGFGFDEWEVPDEDCGSYDPMLYELLLKAREEIFTHLQGSDFAAEMRSLVDFADSLQSNIDRGTYRLPSWKRSAETECPDIAEVLSIFTELEPIDEKWQPYINKCISAADQIKGVCQVHEEWLRKVAHYFIYRYFMKGTFDGEVVSRVRFAVLSTWTIGYLWNFEGCEELSGCAWTAKNYSKETEYSEDNLIFLADAFYERECLSSKALKGLFSKF